MDQIQIINRLSPNRSKGRQGQIPDIIVCHITEGAFPGSINWVMNPQAAVSYHFMVSRAGTIYQCVDIRDTAWANGTDNAGGSRDNRHSRLAVVRNRGINANLYTISIGHEGRYSQNKGALTFEQYKATVSLINQIRGEISSIWGMEIPLTRNNIVGHACITPRHRPNCPGPLFPFDEIIDHLQAQEHKPASWAEEAWQWARSELQMDGTRPQDNITRQEVMVLLHRFYKSQQDKVLS